MDSEAFAPTIARCDGDGRRGLRDGRSEGRARRVGTRAGSMTR